MLEILLFTLFAIFAIPLGIFLCIGAFIAPFAIAIHLGMKSNY